MPFNHSDWIRLPLASSALYLAPGQPAWFVPTAEGDRLLSLAASGAALQDSESQLFLQRLPKGTPAVYPGRELLLPKSPALRELWFHVTDACNMSCSHCLFSAGPGHYRQLPLDQLLQHADTAYNALDCRLFALTGGEPLMYDGFSRLVEGLLEHPEARLVLLSNGILAEQKLDPAWPRERIRLQISLDGSPEQHDAVRGRGSFALLQKQLLFLKENGWQFTLSMCPTQTNHQDIPWLVDFAADMGAAAVHYMWYFIRGRGSEEQAIAPVQLLPLLAAAMERAQLRGVAIDNVEAIRQRIFSPPGTIHDGSSAGVEAAAIGPDNCLYPTAATVGVRQLSTALEAGLAAAWQQSEVLAEIRRTTAAALSTPWRYLHGGGDFDHSYFHSGNYQGGDPYQPLIEAISLLLIEQAAGRLPEPAGAAIRLKMGELLETCSPHGPVALCQSNCLLHDARDSRSGVKRFYAEAAGDRRADILNPVSYADPLLSHIPAEFRFRGYGCGSPILDAALQAGERVADLGSGTGVECFIASRLVGAAGQVTGIDMLEPMLALANRGAEQVRATLGFDNLRFVKGYLEELPLETGSVDVLVSNCVLNLSPDKRRTFAEICRVLAPGGRMVVADVVCEDQPPAAILNDDELRGECIAGAMTHKDLAGIVAESGLWRYRIIRRLPYRTVQGHPFYSLTFVAEKPAGLHDLCTEKVIYPGPAEALKLSGQTWLRAGQPALIAKQEAELFGDQLWRIDSFGFVDNVAMSGGSCCSQPPEAHQQSQPAKPAEPQHSSGCLVCSAPLVYTAAPQEMTCHYCGAGVSSHAACQNGHFVCDLCHIGDSLQRLEQLCSNSGTANPMELFLQIRNHPSFPLHGPQYHALVPGVFLAALRNAGHPVSDEQIRTAISRGAEVPGGSCGFMGVCGAASGIGIAFSVLLEATPLKASQRQIVQQVVQQVLADIASQQAARCCQRDCWLALHRGLLLAGQMFALPLEELKPLACQQLDRNSECSGNSCPLHPASIMQMHLSNLQEVLSKGYIQVEQLMQVVLQPTDVT